MIWYSGKDYSSSYRGLEFWGNVESTQKLVRWSRVRISNILSEWFLTNLGT